MTLGEELRAMSDKAYKDNTQTIIEQLTEICRIKAQEGEYGCATTRYNLDKKKAKIIKKHFAKEGIKFWQKEEAGLYRTANVIYLKW